MHVGKHPRIVGKFVSFFKLHSFISATLCFAENTIKIVFSGRAQLLGITNSKAPLEAPSRNDTFATKSAILGFPLCLLKPLFL